MGAEKIAAIQWKEDVWMVNWQLYYWPEEQVDSDGNKFVSVSNRFQCLGSTFELFFNFNTWNAEWSLKLVPADNGNQVENRPSRVTAVNGIEIQDMVETENEWGPIQWIHNYENDAATLDILYLNNYPQDWPNIQLLMEFQIESLLPAKTSGEQFVLEQMSKLLDTKTMADVQFNVKDEKIEAHSAIVASASPVFADMFQQDRFKDSHIKVIDVEDMEPQVFQQLLRYLYTGVAPQLDEPEMTENLFLAAHEFQIDSLKNLCEVHLISDLSLDNAVKRLELAHLHSSSVLLEGAIACLVKHKDEVWTHCEWRDLGKSYPDLFYIVTHRMVTKNSEATLPLV